MATFGPINSPNTTALFDPMQVEAQLAAMQRNRLLTQGAMEDRAVARQDREREAVGRVSASLLALPEADRPQAYTAAVADLQRDGLAMRAPREYPGHAQIESLARAALPAAKQFELAEKKRASDALMGMLGGLMGGDAGGLPFPPGTPPAPAAPISGAGNAGVPASPPMGPGRDYAAGEEARARLLDQPPEVLAQASAARTTVPQLAGGYRANPGVLGQYNGLAPPSGLINANVGGGGNGLSPTERAAIGVAALTNPSSAPALLMQMQAQRAMQAERAGDNQRADAQFAFQQRSQEQALARQGMIEARADQREQRMTAAQEAAMKRQEARDAAQAETEAERLRLARLAHDPEQIAKEAQARKSVETSTVSAGDRTKLRNIETNAQGIIDALDTYQRRRASAGVGERVQSAVGASTGLNTAFNNAALMAKGEALYDLGVLNGPDLNIIRRTLADPGTLIGGMAGQGTVNDQIGQIKDLINQRLATARRQYGGEGGAAQPASSGGQAAPQRLRFNPATGRIE